METVLGARSGTAYGEATASGRAEVALDRFEWLGKLARRLPEDCLVMSTYIGAVSF